MSRISKSIYKNGNYLVFLDGFTKRFRSLKYGETELISEFPDNIDIKLTNNCYQGCPFCHENSIPFGAHFRLERTKEILDFLPNNPIELAMGGGNLLEIPDDTLGDFINWCENTKGFLLRATLFMKDFISSRYKRSVLFRSSIPLGVSLLHFNDATKLKIDETLDDCWFISGIVFHIIAGVFPKEDLQALFSDVYIHRILVLGYKSMGRGKDYTPTNLKDWELELKRCMNNSNKSICVAFDDLAIEQLNINGAVCEKDWRLRYMGPEFSHSMYIDAVKEEFAKSSTDINRFSWNDINILDFYGTDKKRTIS